MNKIIKILFYILVFLVSVYFNYLTEDPFEINKITIVYFFTGIIFLFWVFKVFKNKKINFPKNKITILALLFLLANIISFIFSIHPYTSMAGNYWRMNGGIFSLLAYLILFLIFIEVFSEKEKSVEKFILAIILSGFIISLYGIFSNWQQGMWVTRAASTFGQPNFFAAFIALLLPLTLSCFLKEKKYFFWKLFFLAIFLIDAFVLILTLSRSAWFGAGISLLILLISLGRKILLLNKKMLFIIVLLFVLITIPLHKQIHSRLNLLLFKELKSPQGILQGTFSLRFFAWQGAWEIFKDNIFVGTGPETFIFSFPKYRNPKINQHIEWGLKFDKAHNEILGILANTGIVGFLTYLTLIFFTLKQTFYSKIKPMLAKSLGASLVAILTTNLFSFSSVTVSLYFWLILGMIVVISSKNIWSINLKITKKYFVFYFLITVFITSYLLFNWGKIYLADVYFKRGYLEEAVKLNPYIDRYHGYLALDYLSRDLFPQAVLEGEKTVEINKLNPDNFRVLAIIYGSKSNDKKYQEKALQAYNQAIKLDPSNPIIYLEKADFLIKIGQEDLAKKNLQKAIDLKPNYTEAINLLKSL